MKIKKQIFKCSKCDIIHFNNGFICNGDFMIKSDLIKLNLSFLQEFINDNISFSYRKYNDNKVTFDNIPKLEKLIYNNVDIPLNDTKLSTKNNKNQNLKILFDTVNNEYVFIRENYFKLFSNEVTFKKPYGECSAIHVFDSYNNCLGLIMPEIPTYKNLEYLK